MEGERDRLHVSLSMSTCSALDRSDTFRLPYNCSNIAVNVFPFYFTSLSLLLLLLLLLFVLSPHLLIFELFS